MAARLVPATMTLFNRVQARMLPTPAKFHYLFNMRDLSKARGWRGLLQWLMPGKLPCMATSSKEGNTCMQQVLTAPPSCLHGHHLPPTMPTCLQVFQGVILAVRDRFAAGASAPFGGRVTSPEGYLLALWAHECSRVFGDKLVEDGEKQWVAGAIAELAQQVCLAGSGCAMGQGGGRT